MHSIVCGTQTGKCSGAFGLLIRYIGSFPLLKKFLYLTADRWKKLIKHVREKVKDHYWSCDGLYERYTQFITEFGKSDSDGSTSGEETCATNTDDAVSDGDTSEEGGSLRLWLQLNDSLFNFLFHRLF